LLVQALGLLIERFCMTGKYRRW